LLITLDTTRVDALGAYAQAQTPHLDRLSSEGVVFDNVYTPVPLTLPAHASLMSGLYPLRHGVRDNGSLPLPKEALTLAEAAQENGFQTAAFVGAVVLDASFGLDQGFDTYDGPGPGKQHSERSAADVVDAALHWWAKCDRTRPYFLWVHFYDPHTPYAPPKDLGGANLRENYAGELAYVDRELERLLARLRADDALEETLTVVVSDHGEGFGEHEENGHSVFCFDTTLRIPLIVRPPKSNPGRFEPGTRSGELLSLVDLYPTIAEALGFANPSDLDGRSFWGAPIGDDHGVYFESYYGYFSFGWSPLTGWIDRTGKYIHSTEPLFFDISKDPGETRNLFAEEDERVRKHRTRVARLAKRRTMEADAVTPSDKALLDGIRGLGYASLGGAEARFPHPLENTGLPNPERMGALYERALEGVELGKQDKLEEAERIFRQVLSENPRNYFVLDHLATCLFRTQRYVEAAETLRTLLRDSPSQPAEVWVKLGYAEQAAQRTDRAIEAFERAVALAPSTEALEILIPLLRGRNQDERARFYAEKLRTLQAEG
jgi:arylsulfatase A-like enzyme